MTRGTALVVAAHPDDCEFGCGGTVAKWADAGRRVELIVLTDGTRGSHDVAVADDDLRELREREQRRGAAVLGVESVSFWGSVDGELAFERELVERLAAAIRERRPETVVTHDPWRLYQLHPDHVAAGRLVCGALFRAGEPRVSLADAPDLAAWRPRDLLLFGPERVNHVEDVEASFARKVEAILCHESQRATSFRFEDGDDDGRARFVERVRTRAAAAGEGAGYRLGEAFHAIDLDHW